MMGEVVIGASGLIGSHLFRDAAARGETATGTYCRHGVRGLKQLDITDEHAVARFLDEEQPDVVYLAAATPNVDWVEENPEESARVNVDAPRGIISVLRGSSTKLVYYSSDYVFDGENGPYVEEDGPNPVNEYGRQKLAVERAIQEELDDWLILRVTVVYGWERRRKNFVHRSICELRSGGCVRAPVDQLGNPTYAPDLARASGELVRGGVRGIFHLVGHARASRYDFALEMARVFELPSNGIQPVETQGLKQQAARPMKAGMIVDRAEAALGRRLMAYPEGLRQMRAEEDTFDEGD